MSRGNLNPLVSVSRQEHGNCSAALSLSLQMDVRQDTLRLFKWHQKLKSWHSNCFLGGTEYKLLAAEGKIEMTLEFPVKCGNYFCGSALCKSHGENIFNESYSFVIWDARLKSRQSEILGNGLIPWKQVITVRMTRTSCSGFILSK